MEGSELKLFKHFDTDNGISLMVYSMAAMIEKVRVFNGDVELQVRDFYVEEPSILRVIVKGSILAGEYPVEIGESHTLVAWNLRHIGFFN